MAEAQEGYITEAEDKFLNSCLLIILQKMVALQYISIVIEALIAMLGIMIALQKKKTYGWGIFLTFGIYVFYDFARLISLNISSNILYWSFFVATVSALWAVVSIYMGGRKRK
jgi:hypothetical protein